MSWVEKNWKPLTVVGGLLGLSWFAGKRFEGAETFDAERIKWDYVVHREPKGTKIGKDGKRIPNPKGGWFKSVKDAETFEAEFKGKEGVWLYRYPLSYRPNEQAITVFKDKEDWLPIWEKLCEDYIQMRNREGLEVFEKQMQQKREDFPHLSDEELEEQFPTSFAYWKRQTIQIPKAIDDMVVRLNQHGDEKGVYSIDFGKKKYNPSGNHINNAHTITYNDYHAFVFFPFGDNEHYDAETYEAEGMPFGVHVKNHKTTSTVFYKRKPFRRFRGSRHKEKAESYAQFMEKKIKSNPNRFSYFAETFDADTIRGRWTTKTIDGVSLRREGSIIKARYKGIEANIMNWGRKLPGTNTTYWLYWLNAKNEKGEWFGRQVWSENLYGNGLEAIRGFKKDIDNGSLQKRIDDAVKNTYNWKNAETFESQFRKLGSGRHALDFSFDEMNVSWDEIKEVIEEYTNEWDASGLGFGDVDVIVVDRNEKNLKDLYRDLESQFSGYIAWEAETFEAYDPMMQNRIDRNECSHSYDDGDSRGGDAWVLKYADLMGVEDGLSYIEAGVKCGICGQERIGSWGINEREGFQITKGEEGRMPRFYGYYGAETFGAESYETIKSRLDKIPNYQKAWRREGYSLAPKYCSRHDWRVHPHQGYEMTKVNEGVAVHWLCSKCGTEGISLAEKPNERSE